MTSVPVDTRPQPAVASPRAQSGFDWFLAVALVACGVAVVRALFFTPADAMLGDVQKLFYVHVPAAIAGLYIGCPLLAITSLVYLWLKDERLDRFAESSAEVSLLFMSVVLTTGPIWGRSSWGTWWVRMHVSPARCSSGSWCCRIWCCVAQWSSRKRGHVCRR